MDYDDWISAKRDEVFTVGRQTGKLRAWLQSGPRGPGCVEGDDPEAMRTLYNSQPRPLA